MLGYLKIYLSIVEKPKTEVTNANSETKIELNPEDIGSEQP